jgi:hypothetical protein
MQNPTSPPSRQQIGGYMKLLARREDLLAEPVGSELILYDPQGKKAHRLSRTAAFLWRKCDGVHTPAHLAKLLHEETGLPQDEEIVVLALDQLQKQRLFKTTSIAGGLSRREAMRKFKALGIAAAMIPVVATIAAPPPAAAASRVSDFSPSNTSRDSEDPWGSAAQQQSEERMSSDNELKPGEVRIQGRIREWSRISPPLPRRSPKHRSNPD